MQDAQKGQTSHPPTLARRDAPCPKQGRSSEVDPRFTFHASRFTVLGSDARTQLADFFNSLLAPGRCHEQIRLFQRCHFNDFDVPSGCRVGEIPVGLV